MLVHAAQEKLPHRMFLFYSNRRPEDAPFLDELQALDGKNQNYTLIATMKEMEKSHRSWHGELGLTSKEMLSRYLKNALSPIYYIAGPPKMVKGVHAMLTEIGVDNNDIRAEEFAGY
jgi:ferredoxin-NADP reductase